MLQCVTCALEVVLMLNLPMCRADLFSESQRIAYTIETRTAGIPDARTYLLTLKEIRERYAFVCLITTCF